MGVSSKNVPPTDSKNTMEEDKNSQGSASDNKENELEDGQANANN